MSFIDDEAIDNVFRPLSRYCWKEPPDPHFNKVERQAEDELFVKEVDKDVVPGCGHRSNYSDATIKAMAQDEIVSLLWRPKFRCQWKVFRDLSVAAADYSFYFSALTAAATLISLLYPEDYLFHRAHSSTLFTQLRTLWDAKFAVMGRQKWPVYEACESIVRHKFIDKETCSFVTEPDVADLISDYNRELNFNSESFDWLWRLPIPEDKDSVFYDLKHVVNKMEPSPRLKVDDSTRLLIKFSKWESANYEDILLSKVVELVDTKAVCNLNPDLLPFYCDEFTPRTIDIEFSHLLDCIFIDLKFVITRQLLKVIFPLSSLERSYDMLPSYHVYEIIEAAELRRTALGCRFIGRSHLLWAFYECGYALPPKIRKTINLNTSNEDYPPYNIYLTSLKLADSLGEQKMQLVHFIFAVLYSKDVVPDENQMVEMKERFNEFLYEVKSDARARGKSRCESRPSSLLEEHFPLGFSLSELKDALQEGKFDQLAEEFALMVTE